VTTIQTEFPFTLPRGYVDADGVAHREGTMRLATARDEIAPLADYRVQRNPGYHVVILLSRVITRLGDVEVVNPRVVEDLFSGDMAFLEDLYRRINERGDSALEVTCPHCERQFDVEVGGVGE
jgi:hypothetical protein